MFIICLLEIKDVKCDTKILYFIRDASKKEALKSCLLFFFMGFVRGDPETSRGSRGMAENYIYLFLHEHCLY